MTISTTDIKLRTPERLTDLADGGGRQTSGTIVDGELNNLFQDTSRLDRVTGRVSLRKAFLHVDTLNTDTLLGAHVILTDPPDDDYTFVSVFASGSPTDERLAAQNRVESYVIAGPESQWLLYGLHITGTRTVRLICRAEVPSPELGEVLLLSTEQDGYTANQQYVRIDAIERSTVTFTDDVGDFQRDQLICTISAQVRYEFYGVETPSRYSSSRPPTKVRRTTVADAARYFSVQPLAAAAASGALVVTVDSPYVPLVPTATAESALIDQTPYADQTSLVPSGPADSMTVSGTIVGTAAPDYAFTLHFGTGIARNSLRVTRGSVSLKDNGGGGIVALTPEGATDGYGGTVDYAEGTFTLTRSSAWSGAVSATATPAGVFVQPPTTKETLITLGNRGYVFVFSCVPLPAPGTTVVSYRALGRWYTLRDNGAGQLQGASTGEGNGTVNYTTGSVSVTLGALPDVNSSILLAWATPRTADARYGDVNIQAPVIEHTLAHAPEAGSLSIEWQAGGVTRTATAAASGVISGAATGQVNHGTGELWLRPTLIPDSNTTFTCQYDKQTSEVDTVTGSVAGQVVTGTIDASGEIKPGSISLAISTERQIEGEVMGTSTLVVVDNGAGGWRQFNTGAALTGTVNYTTGEFSVTIGQTYSERQPQYTYEQVLPYHWIRVTLTGYEVVTSSFVPVAGPIACRYCLASTVATAQTEEVEGPELVIDLTPGIDDQVVSGSTRVTVAGRRYVDRAGSMYYGISPTTGAGTLGGTLALSSGKLTLTDYTGGGAANAATIDALLTAKGDNTVSQVYFRVPAQAIKRGSLALRANRVDTGALMTATSDISGVLTGTGIEGEVDAEMGIVRAAFGEWVTAAGHESEPWYIADAVVAGEIWRPILVDPSSIRYNVVTLRSIPIDAEIIGVDPVRLPVDGRVPWIRPGNVAVIHHTDVESVADPEANDVTDLGRTGLSYAKVRDSAGAEVVSTWYEIDLDAGTVTWSDPLDLSAYTLPILIEHRIEDMIQVSDALITGEVQLARALSRTYPVGSYLSTALIPVPQDLAAAVVNPFAQATWTNEWSDELIGDAPAASYNDLAYPIAVSNRAAMTGRYRIQFTSATAFTAYLEGVGGIGSGVISVDFSPTNPLTGLPYFTIDADGWGSGWASGNVLRFNVQGASYPLWFARCTLPGPIDEPSDSVKVELRGDAD